MRFQELLANRLNRHAHDPGLEKTLEEIELQLLSEWGTAYGQQWEDYQANVSTNWDQRPVPQKFETAFGAAPHEGDEEVPDERHPCLELGVSHRKVRIRGRIDRIDVGKLGKQMVFNIVDYKTGKANRIKPKDVKEGRAIQLALYALAVQRLGIVGDGAWPHQLMYWYIKETGHKEMLTASQMEAEQFIVSDDWQQLQEILEEQIPELAAGIRKGDFPVYSSDDQCTTFCPYKMTCRVTEIRSLQDTMHKTWTLGQSSQKPES